MAAEQNALMEAAKCFRCLSYRELIAIQTYCLAVNAGGSLDPSALQAAATGFRGVDNRTLENIILYLLCSQSTAPVCTPAALAETAACYECIPRGFQAEAQTYLAAVIANGSTDPATLSRAAKCFCADTPTLLQIQAYVLNADSLTVQALAEASKCYGCLSGNRRLAVRTLLFNTFSGSPNIVPDGSTYEDDGEGNPIFILDVIAHEFYDIVWGANELSVQIGADVYMSTGVGTTTRVNTGNETQMIFTGLFAGTTVTVVVRHQNPPPNPQKPSDPLNFTFVETGAGTTLTASWDLPQNTVGTELWTATDGKHFSLETTVAGNVTTAVMAAPGAGTTVTAKIKHCAQKHCSSWSNKVAVTVVGPITDCGTATNVIVVSGAGDPDANGNFVFDQTAYNNTGVVTYTQPTSLYYIEFSPAGGYDAFLYDAAAIPMYRLPTGSCFPCAGWETQFGVNPAPSMAFGSEDLADAYGWADRVVTNGGARPSNTTITAAGTFLAALDTAGIKSKFKTLNIYAPDNLKAALTPLIKGVGRDPWVNGSGLFIAGDLTVNGLKGNVAAGKFATTGVIPSSHLSLTSMGMTIYAYEAASANMIDGGAQDGAGQSLQLAANYSGVTRCVCWDPADAMAPANSGAGYYSLNRVAANSMDVYYAKGATAHSSKAHVATTSGIRPTYEIYAHAMNLTGGSAVNSSNRLSFFAIHDGFTVTESAALYNAVQALRTALGGGWV